MNANNDKRPATLLPPPLVYVAALWGSWELNTLVPLPFQKVSFLGWLFVALGCLLLLWAAVTLLRHKTTVNPYATVSRLVVNGPFRFSRNPIYLADSVIYLGIALIWGLLWPLLLYPLVWAAIHYGVIKNEEAHLSARFGESYAGYRARVRRWI